MKQYSTEHSRHQVREVFSLPDFREAYLKERENRESVVNVRFLARAALLSSAVTKIVLTYIDKEMQQNNASSPYTLSSIR